MKLLPNSIFLRLLILTIGLVLAGLVGRVVLLVPEVRNDLREQISQQQLDSSTGLPNRWPRSLISAVNC